MQNETKLLTIKQILRNHAGFVLTEKEMTKIIQELGCNGHKVD
jgi:hypothetical protein